jgi:predicted RNA-binding protein with EMAP domain
MEQIEVISWKTLDALKQTANNTYDTIGNLDTNEQMSVFCAIEDDFFELYYSELESNYIRHFEDEDELLKYKEQRKEQLGEEDFSTDYYDEDSEYDDSSEDYSGYRIRDEEEDEDY